MQFVTPAVGDVVGGRYRVVRALGSGGMSAVFEAENTFTNKRVALKWLLPTVGGRPEAKERLLREARAGSRIKHRHVVDIYDVAFEGDSMFLVMALLQGETLGHLLESRTISVQALLQLLLPVMRGVAEAHRQGVIHRDIKPDNIFLSHEVDNAAPVPVVLDFGIAKIEGDALRTRSGSAIGTPVFMSFEQVRGLRDLDARVDVYGFGVIIYMALTGRLPHSADSWPELVYKLSSADVPAVLSLRPDFSPVLSAIIARALERDRDVRTPSLEQLISELAPFADTRDELGQTLVVTYERELQLPPLLGETQPSTGLSSADERIGELVSVADEKPALALSSQRDTQTAGSVAAPWLTRDTRARYAAPAVGLALAALGIAAASGWLSRAPVRVAAPARQAQGAQAGAVSTALPAHPERDVVTAPSVRQEKLSMLGATAPGALPDAALMAAPPTSTSELTPGVVTRVGSSLRVRRAAPVETVDDMSTPAAPAAEPSAGKVKRRRLSQEDFFGSTEQ